MATKKAESRETKRAETYDPVGEYPPRSYEEARDPEAEPEVVESDRPDAPVGYIVPDHARLIPHQQPPPVVEIPEE